MPLPGDLPDSGIEPTSPMAPALQADSLLLSHQESPDLICGFLASQPGIESAPCALEGKVLTTGPPGMSSLLYFLISRE